MTFLFIFPCPFRGSVHPVVYGLRSSGLLFHELETRALTFFSSVEPRTLTPSMLGTPFYNLSPDFSPEFGTRPPFPKLPATGRTLFDCFSHEFFSLRRANFHVVS